MNKCTFIGRIASDLELKTAQSGESNIAFRLAVPRSYKDKNGERPTDFIPCVAWRHTAEFINKFIHKGDKVGVAGELQIRKYTGQDGMPRYAYEIQVKDVEGCGVAQGKNEQDGSDSADANGFIPVGDDALPF